MRIFSFSIVVAIFFMATMDAQTTWYVKPVTSGTGDGSSWGNASADIQFMISNSASGDQIWVAAGTYKPTRLAATPNAVAPNNRRTSFVIKNGVSLLGGFSGSDIS